MSYRKTPPILRRTAPGGGDRAPLRWRLSCVLSRAITCLCCSISRSRLARPRTRRLHCRLNMRLGDWAFGPLHRIRILELNGDPSLAIGKTYLLHHEAQIRCGFRYREVPALFTLLGRPSEKPEGPGAVASSDGIFHIRICPRLVQLVIKCCDDVFPRLIEGDDPIVGSVWPPFGEHADRIIDRDRPRRMN
jgi:hypothetical protein